MLWKLLGFERAREIELIVPRGRRRAHQGHIVHFLNSLPASDLTLIDAIPVTTPSRTILDLASVVRVEVLEELLDDALGRRMSTIPRLQRQIAAVGPRPGLTMLRTLLDARDTTRAIPESVLETKIFRVLKKAGLPTPVTQFEIRDGNQLIARVDFAFPHIRLAIEADGFRWHSGRQRWQHDLARRNALTNLGWRLIHVTWQDIARPDTVIQHIEHALQKKLFDS
jgi:hypothetical protein